MQEVRVCSERKLASARGHELGAEWWLSREVGERAEPAHMGCRARGPVTVGWPWPLRQGRVPTWRAARSVRCRPARASLPGTLLSTARRTLSAPYPELSGSECVVNLRIVWIIERWCVVHLPHTSSCVGLGSSLIKYCVLKC